MHFLKLIKGANIIFENRINNFIYIKPLSDRLVFLTASTLLRNLSLLISLRLISIISSNPLLPIIQGTPMHKSSTLYSPFSITEQGKVSFESLSIDLTRYATDAQGAYQAEVPNNFVKEAPPTIVSEAILEILSTDNKSVKGLLFTST